VKSRQKTEYGDKVFVVGDASNLIIDCVIESGADFNSSPYQESLDRQREYYSQLHRQTNADGGFASIDDGEIFYSYENVQKCSNCKVKISREYT